MSKILLGFALIMASMQTAWALFAEGQTVVLPAVAAFLYLGARCIKGGISALSEWCEVHIEID